MWLQPLNGKNMDRNDIELVTVIAAAIYIATAILLTLKCLVHDIAKAVNNKQYCSGIEDIAQAQAQNVSEATRSSNNCRQVE